MSTNLVFQNTLTGSGVSYPIFPGPIMPHWLAAADLKGFVIVGRIVDRLHLALRCKICGALSKTRLYTVMTAQPLCPACIEEDWRDAARSAGLTFLRRDPEHRHYAYYRAPCGHEVRRQLEMVRRMAAGATGIRCEECHAAVEATEAAQRGWRLLGPDFDGDPNYRSYHHERCGQEQRIARANMQSGRFTCSRCGDGWPTGRSFIYLMKFTLASSREVIKLGFSRDPRSRLTWQLQRDTEMPTEILRTVAMPSGRIAMSCEKRMHARLRKAHPDLVIDPAVFRGQLNVRSEIYDASLTPVILGLLDEIETADSES